MTARLSWDVFVGPPAPLAGQEALPGRLERTWSPISATLISGERDAVLVDALLTADQGCELADWVVARGRNLTSVYITHGHGDHWFGLGLDPRPLPRRESVRPSHRDRADAQGILEETRQYIRDFERILDSTETAQELYDQVLALYPDRINPGALWLSAQD